MPRKGEVKKRELLPDPKYGDKVVARFVNTIMSQGKKSVAESIFYRSLDIVTAKAKEDALGVFKRAIENTRPTVEVRSRRVGGAAARRLKFQSRYARSGDCRSVCDG